MLKAGKNVGTNECLLLIGESGVGKTLLGESYGKLCSFPFTCFNSTDATSIGYVGLDLVEDGIKSLIRAAGDNPKDPITIEKARLGGIIFYDEFTKKMASPASSNSSGRDISGIAVQQEILRAMEGCKVIIGGRKEKETGMEFDTTGCMFLFGGFIEGLDKVIARLNRRKSSMGFSGFSNHSVEPNKFRDSYLYDCLLEQGFCREYLNRLTKIVQFRKLTVKDLETIAVSPSGCIASYNRQLLPMGGLSIKVSNQAISMMAGFCVETGMMARGLRMIIGALVEDLVFSGAKGEIPFLSKDVKRVIEGMSVGKS
jgi:ATP-dependent Clp protease ATP-binding subunit ClpX